AGPGQGAPVHGALRARSHAPLPMNTHHVLEGPAGAPVVTLAHPLGATLALWDAQVEALLPRYRVLRYDIRGHGASAAPAGPYTLEQIAGDLHVLLERLGICERVS